MLFVKNIRLFTGEELIEDGCLLCDGDVIAYAGSAQDCTPPADAQVIDGKGGLCLPGMMNAHSHVPMSLLRGVGSDLALMDWLGCVMPIEPFIVAEPMYIGATLGIAEMIRTGTTGFADMYFYEDSIAKAALDAGIRANVCRGNSDEKGVDDNAELYRQWHGAGSGRIRVSMGLHAEYTSNPEIAAYAINAAAKLGAAMQVHVSESAGEVAACRERHAGKSPVAYFRDLGLFDNPTVAAHCVHLDEADQQIMKEKGVYLAHCPASNLKLASGIAPVRTYVEKGLRVALGTDGAASNNALDMFREMWLMALLQKGSNLDATAMPALQALQIATRQGALALGFDDCGLLKPGFQADFVLLDADSVSLWPGNDPLADAVYAAGGKDVRMTVAAGKILYKDGEYTTIDMERLQHDVKKTVAELMTHR